MKLFARREAAEPARAHQRGPTFQGGLHADPFLLEQLAGLSSARVSRRDALSVPAVLKARNMIAGIPSTLPINVHDRTLAIDTRNSVVVDPGGPFSDVTASWVYAATFEDLLFESVSYWRVTRMSAEGFPIEAHHLDHRAVSQHSILGMPSEVLSEDLQFSPRDPIYVDGMLVPSREIIRFISPNPPLLKHAARAIRMALLLDKAAEVYADDPMPLGYFTDGEGADPLEDEEITEVLDAWAAHRRARAFGYVPNGLDLKTVQWNAEQIQLADARQHAVLEIARATGLDPEDIGVSVTSRTYQNSVDRKQTLIDFVLMPWMNAVEQRLSKDDVLPRGLHARFDTSGFLRSDMKTRMESNEIGRRIGAITDDEIRTGEHKPPLTGAEKSVIEQRSQPVAVAAPNGREPEMSSNSNGNGARFASGGDVLRLEVPEVDAQFRVDRSRRLISGLVLPWAPAVAYSGGFKWRFQRGSVSWSDVSRVKLLRDHDMHRPVGVALELDDREDGLHGTFSIARGESGDEVLSLAEDGVLDGFSAGPNFESPDSWTRDPSAADVRLVRASRLIETTITAIPAFDSARVQSVVAQHQGASMGTDGNGDGKPAAKLEPDTSGMERFEVELDARMAKMTDKLAESQGAQQESIAKTVSDAFAAAFQRLGDIDTTGRGELAQARIKVIREEPVYRFNGDRTGPSLVRDAWLAKMEGDHEAMARQRKFMEQQRDMVNLLQVAGVTGFAPETTVTTPQIIPPGYRPDLFVTELNRGRPIVAQASRGTITDATPFTVPRFVSSTGATADHVEGTNPADADMTLDTTTITPGAISGSFKVSREIMDSSNPAIDAIALGTMRESYNRQTESKAYLALKDKAVAPLVLGVTAAELTTVTGATASAVVRRVRNLLSLYPFTRFAAPTGAVINGAVTSYFAQVEDTTNRPLLPSIGATNSAGLGNAVQQGWFVDGLPFVPAWAQLDAIGDDVLIILNRADFWVWESPLLTFRFEEKQGPAVIELALFSYYASHVLRPAGLAALNKTA